MRKKAFLSFLMVVMLLISAGCGSGDSGSSNGKGTDSGASPEGSKGTGRLTVYSPNQAEINNPIIKEFQDRTGIQVQLISGGTGELLKRVEAEASNPLGDVFFGGGQESHDAYKDYFEPYVTSEIDNLEADYTDPGQTWTPLSILPMIIIYNQDLVPEGEKPKGWEDLLDPKWKGKIAFSDPARSASSYTQMVTMLTAFGLNDEKGWDFIKKFVGALDNKILSSSSMVYKGVADKEFALGITSEDAALRYIEGGAKVGIIYPEEGTSARADALSIMKGAKNLEEAKQFIDFVAGPDVQSLIQKEFKRRSVRKDAEKVEGIPLTKDIKVLPYDTEWASNNKDEAVARFTRIVTGQEQ
ncbi:ABC transporter substrate-binding protein [Paenibacillus sp. J2TS4]|uniref:ABC transporter substrate-binding protein n=1 Tax=Paenibacillus sp. J2TS4 TaxID=2807194 RepID=UPI001B16597A|nr:ABC transporter substrate-binding protein [Paenibacillus sp. J2TS4]GIP34166.1 iron ABC transporter substrate-binding protein [Paenibacillus sp. J2TS4]